MAPSQGHLWDANAVPRFTRAIGPDNSSATPIWRFLPLAPYDLARYGAPLRYAAPVIRKSAIYRPFPAIPGFGADMAPATRPPSVSLPSACLILEVI